MRAVGLVGRSPLAVLKGLAQLPAASLDARRLLNRFRPDIVVGLGGYSSGPVVLLAALRRIATLLMEQNAVPGVTNRLLGAGRAGGGGLLRRHAELFRCQSVRERQSGASGFLRRSTAPAGGDRATHSWCWVVHRGRMRSTS